VSDSEVNGRVRGATEALSVLQSRPRARRPPIGGYTRELLAGHLDTGAWNSAGLPTLPPQPDPMSISTETVIRLARLTVSEHCTNLRLAERPAVWSRLEAFFAQRTSACTPEFLRLREVACRQRQEAGCDPPDIGSLTEILEFHRKIHGDDSYLAGLTRGNLSDAYRISGAFELAARLIDTEAEVRANRYGPDHPVTLVTRSMLARILLLQAEAADDAADRLTLARRALSLINDVRTARDRLFGITAPNATISRRYEGHALLLLGELERARACLEHTLAFEIARDGRRDLYSAGRTHLLLARVCAAQGDRDQALHHAECAREILSAHIPQGAEAAEAASFARDLAHAHRG
jgi:tetratricopeptide (TPR) repeat protein